MIIFIASTIMGLYSPEVHAQYPVEQKILAETDRLYAQGNLLYERGYRLQADWYYGQAVVAVQSFKYALSLIAYQMVVNQEQKADAAASAAIKAEIDKGPEQVDDSWNDVMGFDVNSMLAGLNNFAKAASKVSDAIKETGEKLEDKMEKAGLSVDYDKEERTLMWNNLANFSIVSPYPFLFEGLVEGYLGNTDAATSSLLCAFSNPYIIPTDLDFSFIYSFSLSELRALYARLDAKYTEYIQGRSFTSTSFKRDWRNFNDAWLIHRGSTFLEDEENLRPEEAVPYFDAAVCSNPFDVDNFVMAAYAHIATGNYEKAAEYINEGLLLQPGNSDLKEMVNDFKK